jgi:peptide/nickel transport system substrate-binding protein
MVETVVPTLAHRRRAVVTSVVTALAATALAACGTSGSPSAADRTEVSVMIPALGDLLDPRAAAGPADGGLLIGLEPLLRYQPDGSLAPDLATAVKQPDELDYVFTIRHGVKFWDGSTLTPEDVAYSLSLHIGKNSQSQNAALFTSVASVKAAGDDQVEVHLSRPDPQLEYSVAQIGIVSQAFYDKHGKSVGTPSVLNMGTGPYKFAGFTPSKEIKFVANPAYWGPKPSYQKLTVDVVSDDAARLNGLQSGAYDVAFNLPLSQVASVARLKNLQLANTPDVSVYKFNHNVGTTPWNDIHLRRAFAMAIDRPGIVAGALSGNAVLAPTLVPEPVMQKFAGAQTTTAYQQMEKGYPYDIQAAKAELAKSSRPNGLTTQVLVTSSDPNLALIAQTAAQSLAKIGIKLEVKQVDDPTYYNAVYFKHTTQGVSLDLFSAAAPDAANIPIYSLLSANSLVKGGGGQNISDYVNPAVDTLLEKSQRNASDKAAAGAALLSALETAQQDVPYVPIAFPKIYDAAAAGLHIEGFDAFWWMVDWPEHLAG